MWSWPRGVRGRPMAPHSSRLPSGCWLLAAQSSQSTSPWRANAMIAPCPLKLILHKLLFPLIVGPHMRHWHLIDWLSGWCSVSCRNTSFSQLQLHDKRSVGASDGRRNRSFPLLFFGVLDRSGRRSFCGSSIAWSASPSPVLAILYAAGRLKPNAFRDQLLCLN